MYTPLRIATLLSLSTFVAVGCSKDTEKKETAAPTAKSAEAEAPPAAAKAAEPAKAIELTDSIDVGAVITDADETRYQGLKVKAPAGSKASDNDGMALTVSYGEVAYELRYEFDDENAVAKGKTAAGEDKLDKLVKFHVDTPEAILWETASELGGPNNFHFVATVKLGDKNLLCKNSGWGSFTRAQAEALLKSCQSATK
jgi:hypothetical protein